MSAEGIPHVQVTMIGNTGSGKTTYLIGMYAEMSVGVNRYFLTSDHDTHINLTSAWSALIEEGILPKGTESSSSYSFMFRYGTLPLLSLEWIDYRGGAVRGTTDDPQTAALIERLGHSDSLYLTLDGNLLASVLMDKKGAERRLRATTSLYSNMLNKVLDERAQADLIPPSIVLLVTKSDLLTDHLEGDSEERRRKLSDWIEGRFEQIIGSQLDVAICTVSLGELGEETSEHVDAQLVDPLRIHKPMVFTLYAYYRRAAMLFEASAEALAAEGNRGLRELQELGGAPAMKRVLGRKRARELSGEVGRSAAAIEAYEALAGECFERVHVLEGELSDIATFFGGERLGAA
jgi:hypothetical protein